MIFLTKSIWYLDNFKITIHPKKNFFFVSCVTFLLCTFFQLYINKADDQALSDKFQISLYVNGALGVFQTTIPMTRINWLFFALSRLFVDDNGRVNIDWSQWLIEARHLGTQWLNCMCTEDLNEHLIVGFISNQICLVNRKKTHWRKPCQTIIIYRLVR